MRKLLGPLIGAVFGASLTLLAGVDMTPARKLYAGIVFLCAAVALVVFMWNIAMAARRRIAYEVHMTAYGSAQRALERMHGIRSRAVSDITLLLKLDSTPAALRVEWDKAEEMINAAATENERIRAKFRNGADPRKFSVRQHWSAATAYRSLTEWANQAADQVGRAEDARYAKQSRA